QKKTFTIYVDTGKEDYKQDHRVYANLVVDEPEVCVYNSKEIRFKKGNYTPATIPPAIGVCVAGQTQACGSDIGVCKKGVQSCVNCAWGSCAGEVKGVREVCGDELDNDCNGRIDCEDSYCSNSAGCKTDTTGSEDGDQDGLPDRWEERYFDDVEFYTSDDDPDNDGFTNIQEYVSGTDPNDGESKPESGIVKTLLVILGALVVVGILIFIILKYAKKPEEGKMRTPKKAEASSGASDESLKKMEEYIKNSFDKGYTQQQIKTALAIKGWNKAEIETGFKKVK
ncbi:MAG TPA: hypothetical protein VJH95_05055, partial [Candidatus Nanoarchaeia archaeon]|nr:hypothetical protein [Candidatus Nanoarchaeia archaeon]